MKPYAIQNALAEYHAHGLEDLERAELMNRVDSKFLVPKVILPEILQALSHEFTALQIGENRIFNYESVYFDTLDYQFYFLHHGGKLNRHKVRLRRYVDSGVQFLEVKFKNNKKRTIKSRIQTEYTKINDLQAYSEFLDTLGVPDIPHLRPVLQNGYQRIQLASEQRGERLTIDLNLSNQSLYDGDECSHLHDLVIIELKQSKVDRNSPFYKLARKHNLRPSSFSKYCMGVTFTQGSNELKHNRFKPIIKRLDNLKNTYRGELELC